LCKIYQLLKILSLLVNKLKKEEVVAKAFIKLMLKNTIELKLKRSYNKFKWKKREK